LFKDFEIPRLGNKSLAPVFMNRWYYTFYKASELGNVTDNPLKSLEGIK
jgi:hypothetical protein